MYKIFLIILFSVITISKTSATANSLLELENFVTAHRDTKSLCLNKYSRLSEADLLTSCVQEQEKGLAFVDIILSLEKPADWAIRTIRRNISKYQGQNEYVVDWSIFGEDLNNELTAQNDVIFFNANETIIKR